ncbi:hypothetical protein KSP35_10380 [Aquihabitans sp. G128]|uniref:hypothetical protein n=1 Tax=Aquihabitans sp. G128 TaxID=2849779 RepID=UPI001C24C688|nr:hypothetical protein [Aquihabitans sp. G128]QXC63147.1 hypothetical protein KSP35_10380 [Aquihabitans sp. G128]
MRSGAAARRARWPFVVGGLVLLLVLAVVAGAALSGDGGDTPPTTTAAPPVVPTLPKGSPGTPKDVEVDDQGTKATITWTDTTKGAGTPGVLVLDEEGNRKATALDDGQTSFVAEDLDPDLGYCFVVSMIFPGAGGAGITNVQSEPACIRGAEIEAPTTTTAKPKATTTTTG